MEKVKLKNYPFIIFAEDDDDHFYIAEKALRHIKPNLALKRVVNGQELISLLKENEGEQKMPSLIILDLNMPKTDGRQFLEIFSQNPEWIKIPVGVLTTSPNEDDKNLCRQKGVKLYYQKPTNFQALVEMMNNLLQLTHPSSIAKS